MKALHRIAILLVPITLFLVSAIFILPAFAYEPGVGHLPNAKARADSDRLAKVIEEYETKRLQGCCVYTMPKHGPMDMLGLLNEEGRGYFPPRSGYEVALYKRIKQAAQQGETLDLEKMLEIGLDVCTSDQGEVYLQDVFLTIHNVTRLLARPETWWTDGTWEFQKDASGIGMGNIKLTAKRWQPGWRGMENDSVYPIIQDIVGDKSTTSETPTLPEIRKAIFYRSTPEGEAKFQKYNLNRQKSRQRIVNGLKSNIAKEETLILQHEKQQRLLKQVHAFQRDENWAAQYDYHSTQIEAVKANIELYRAELTYREKELNSDITGNVYDVFYTKNLFALPDSGSGLFHPLYGAEDREGNGGNWYYFWLGAFVENAGSKLANFGGALWETAWLNDDERGRKGIQISHFEGGGVVSERLRLANSECIKRVAARAGRCPSTGCKPLRLCDFDGSYTYIMSSACDNCAQNGELLHCEACEKYKHAVDECSGGGEWIPNDTAWLGGGVSFEDLRKRYLVPTQTSVFVNYFETRDATECFELEIESSEPSVQGRDRLNDGSGRPSGLSGDDELAVAQREYNDAFETYTRLVTTGGTGSVETALTRYRQAYERLQQIKANPTQR